MQRIFKRLQDDASELASESKADVEIVVKYRFRAQSQAQAQIRVARAGAPARKSRSSGRVKSDTDSGYSLSDVQFLEKAEKDGKSKAARMKRTYNAVVLTRMIIWIRIAFAGLCSAKRLMLKHEKPKSKRTETSYVRIANPGVWPPPRSSEMKITSSEVSAEPASSEQQPSAEIPKREPLVNGHFVNNTFPKEKTKQQQTEMQDKRSRSNVSIFLNNYLRIPVILSFHTDSQIDPKKPILIHCDETRERIRQTFLQTLKKSYTIKEDHAD
ncbi:unnamed protein product, partial [Gongylonema pulchrum]|uniref:Uncharacterized protein n=1 Tax=Gongylonema pulchrum TaxID=637853 RepID=A0A183CX23_9BILA